METPGKINSQVTIFCEGPLGPAHVLMFVVSCRILKTWHAKWILSQEQQVKKVKTVISLFLDSLYCCKIENIEIIKDRS